MAALGGLLLAVVTVLKALDIGMLVGFYRTFDPLSDPSYVGSGYGVLRDSVGSVRAVLVAVALAVAVVAAWCCCRGRPSGSPGRRPVTAGPPPSVSSSPAWSGVSRRCSGRRSAPDLPVASAQTATVAADHVRDLRQGVADRAEFERLAAERPATRRSRRGSLLTGLQGKDVLVVFVESYGRVALTDPAPRADRHRGRRPDDDRAWARRGSPAAAPS